MVTWHFKHSFRVAILWKARDSTPELSQAEACEAGLEPRALQEWLRHVDEEEPLAGPLREEVRRWSRLCVDVDALQGRARRAEETCRLLSKKVSALQRQLHKLQLERLNEYNKPAAGLPGPDGQRDEPNQVSPRSSFAGRSAPRKVPEENVGRTFLRGGWGEEFKPREMYKVEKTF